MKQERKMHMWYMTFFDPHIGFDKNIYRNTHKSYWNVVPSFQNNT